MENSKRLAFLRFKTVDAGIPYCTHGKAGDSKKPTDCQPMPAGSSEPQYNFKILPQCVCTSGTHCDDTLTYPAIGSVVVTIFALVSLSTLLESNRPVHVQYCLMTFGVFWVAIASITFSGWSFFQIGRAHV